MSNSAGLAVFTAEQTHGLSLLPHSKLLVSSDGLDWTSAYVSRQHQEPYQAGFSQCPDSVFGFVMTKPVMLSRSMQGTRAKGFAVPGSLGIVPDGMDFSIELAEPAETLVVYIRRRILDEVSEILDIGGAAPIGFLPRFCAVDPLLESMACDLLEVVREGSSFSGLYADHLARMIAIRLIANHSDRSGAVPTPHAAQGLSPSRLRRVSDFVESHIADPLSLDEVADEVGLSPSHLMRQFKASNGISVHQYVIRRRVDRARRLLAETDIPISQICVDCGFSHQAHLTRTFSRLVGRPPAAFRRQVHS